MEITFLPLAVLSGHRLARINIMYGSCVVSWLYSVYYRQNTGSNDKGGRYFPLFACNNVSIILSYAGSLGELKK